MKLYSQRIIRITLALLLVLALCFQCLGVQAFAEEENEFEVSGSKVADPTSLEGDKRTSTVTLSLPSGEYKNQIDIVFVMDNSTSVANAGINFSDNVQRLMNGILEKNPGIELKVSVVKFRGYATDMLDGDGLVVYKNDTEDNSERVIAAIENNSVPGSGSNVHSGLMMANTILDGDEEVDDSHKYVVLLTDCKSYIWNSASGEPLTYYSQSLRKNAVQQSGKPFLNQWNGIYNKELGGGYVNVSQVAGKEPFNMLNGEVASATDAATSAYYQKLYDCGDAEIGSTTTVYDAPAYYSKYYPADSYTGTATPGDGTVTARTVGNASEKFGSDAKYSTFYDYTPTEGTFWTSVRYQQLNPYEVVQNEDEAYVYDYDKVNEDFWLWHPSALEKGIYQAGHYWSETIDQAYNTAVIALYKNDGTGDKIVGSFQKWLFENSDFSADVNQSDAVLALFEDIDNSIRYMVSKGVVTDVIGDEFDLKNPDSADCFKMTLNGSALACSFADGKWNFGEATDGVYPYVIEFDGSKTITWTINVPIENLKPVTLSYDVELLEGTVAGKYPTNKSAVLEYTSSDGKKDGTYTFDVPEVEYILQSITVAKKWEDADDQDGLRPDSVTVRLYADGKEVASHELTERENWQFTFKDQLIWKENADGSYSLIEYSLKEDAFKGYQPEITPKTASYKEGSPIKFTVTNTHEPAKTEITITKAWEDADDQDGLRPSADDFAALLHLMNGETEVKKYTPTVTDEGDGSYTVKYSGMPKYAAGVEITYTVKEDGIDSYTAKDDKTSAADGETITNVHEPEMTAITVTKVWDDNDNKKGIRPDSVTVKLLADGKDTGKSLTLDEAGKWTGTFEDLPVNNAGKKIDYTIDEVSVKKYETEIEKTSDTEFTITNTYNESPQTGDENNLVLWYVLAALALTGAVVTLFVRKKEN